MWQIYQRPVVRIPTNKPCIRKHLPLRMFDTMDEKWDAVVERVLRNQRNGRAGAGRHAQRAGIGGSEPSPGRRRARRIAC